MTITFGTMLNQMTPLPPGDRKGRPYASFCVILAGDRKGRPYANNFRWRFKRQFVALFGIRSLCYQFITPGNGCQVSGETKKIMNYFLKHFANRGRCAIV